MPAAKPYDAILKFKILILHSLHNLSDEQTEYLIRDQRIALDADRLQPAWENVGGMHLILINAISHCLGYEIFGARLRPTSDSLRGAL